MRSALLDLLKRKFIETIVRGWTCRPTRTHYPDYEPTHLRSFSLMLHAYQRSNKYQCDSL